MGFDVGEPDGGVSNQLVEVLHDHLLGQDRQVAERSVGEALVKAPVEQRAGVGILAHAVQRTALMLLELSARPAVPLTQPVAQRQNLQDYLSAHQLSSGSSPSDTTLCATASSARSPFAGRL